MSLSRAISRVAFSFLLCTAVATFGCRGDDGTEENDTDGGGDDTDGNGGGGEDVTIQEVQGDSVAVGDPVTLRGVVVVAVDTAGERKGSIFVAEPEGGPYSGVYVFLNSAEATGLNPGDLVDVEGGVKDEFALSADTSGRTVTEVSAPEGGAISITKVGTGTVPAPSVVDPVAFATDEAEAEKWEGVLISFENVSVLSPLDEFGEITITGPVNVESELYALPDTIAAGDCYASVTGLVHYFFDYSLQPRSADDLAAGGSCLPPEDTEALCTDGEDNDADGFADCMDFSCQSLDICTSAATVVEIQDGTIAEGTHVQVTGAIVTAIDFDREHLWVQDNAAAGEYNGVYVYRGSGATPLDDAITVGSIINIEGNTTEFHLADGENTLTEIEPPGGGAVVVTDAMADGTPKVLTGVTLATLADVGDAGEPYEGVLVTIENVTVESVDTTNHEYVITDGTASLTVDDTIFRQDPAVGDCLTITGIMHVNAFEAPGNRLLLPRTADDITTGTCN